MKTLKQQPLLLVARQAVLVFVKELAQQGVLVALVLALEGAELDVGLAVGMSATMVAILDAIALVTGLARLLARRTVTILAREIVAVDVLLYAKAVALAVMM